MPHERKGVPAMTADEANRIVEAQGLGPAVREAASRAPRDLPADAVTFLKALPKPRHA